MIDRSRGRAPGLFSPLIFWWLWDSFRRECVNLSATARIGGFVMRTPLLEILREIPDHRRVEGRRFDLATVLLYSIVAMVGGANSYRQMHEFIRIHRQSLNAASASNCVMRRLTRACGSSCTASIPAHWRAPFGARVDARRAARDRRASGDRGGRQNPARQLRRLLRPQGRAYDDGVAPRRPNRARACDGCGKEQRNPDRAELIEALGVKDRLFTLDAEHCQKNRSRA